MNQNFKNVVSVQDTMKRIQLGLSMEDAQRELKHSFFQEFGADMPAECFNLASYKWTSEGDLEWAEFNLRGTSQDSKSIYLYYDSKDRKDGKTFVNKFYFSSAENVDKACEVQVYFDITDEDSITSGLYKTVKELTALNHFLDSISENVGIRPSAFDCTVMAYESNLNWNLCQKRYLSVSNVVVLTQGTANKYSFWRTQGTKVLRKINGKWAEM